MCADAALGRLARRGAGDVAAVQADAAAARRAASRRWPRRAPSARCRRRRRCPRSRPRARPARGRARPPGRGRRRRAGPRTCSAKSLGAAGSLSTRSSTSRPTISSARPCFVAPSMGTVADLLAAPQDRHAVGDGEHLVELVGDDDDGGAAGLELAQHREQLLRLLRRQHRRRLVQDQHLGVAVQRLEDLDALLLAHREVLDAGLRRHRQAVLARQLADALLRGRHVDRDALARLRGEHDVLRHRHHRDQHEVLVHHADPGVDGVGRRREAAPPGRRPGSRPRRAGTARRGSSSASTCRRRSRRAGRGSRPARTSRSTASLATMPGKTLVTPRSSSTGVLELRGSVPAGGFASSATGPRSGSRPCPP